MKTIIHQVKNSDNERKNPTNINKSNIIQVIDSDLQWPNPVSCTVSDT